MIPPFFLAADVAYLIDAVFDTYDHDTSTSPSSSPEIPQSGLPSDANAGKDKETLPLGMEDSADSKAN